MDEDMGSENLMGYLGEYLRWRGDLMFSQTPFCYADSLALTMLSYLNPEEVSKDQSSLKNITLRELSRRYARCYVPAKKPGKLSMMARAPELLALMASCRRFSEIEMADYDCYIDTELEGQFAAMTFSVGEHSIYITYRGTDNNMIGWKEDFNMSYLNSVPAQKSAVEYLSGQHRKGLEKIVIGGHSKGGNLAVYAASCADAKMKSLIAEVHSFDGPGFSEDFLQREDYGEISGRVIDFMPQGSLVGRLFEHRSQVKIIRSDSRGIMQHIPFHWKIEGGDFLYAEEFDTGSQIFCDIMAAWLSEPGNREKKMFIDAVFDVLEDTGISKTEELKVDLSKVRPLIQSVSGLPKESRSNFLRMIGTLLKETGYAVQQNLFSSDAEERAKR